MIGKLKTKPTNQSMMGILGIKQRFPSHRVGHSLEAYQGSNQSNDGERQREREQNQFNDGDVEQINGMERQYGLTKNT